MDFEFEPEQKGQLRLEKLIRHHERADRKKFYSIQRMDLLIIAISTSGVVFVAQIFQYLEETNIKLLDNDTRWLIVITAILNMAAILANFFSQVTGERSNHYEREWANCEIKKSINQDKLDSLSSNQTEADSKVDFYDKWTKYLNRISIVFMAIAIFLSGIIVYKSVI